MRSPIGLWTIWSFKFAVALLELGTIQISVVECIEILILNILKIQKLFEW